MFRDHVLTLLFSYTIVKRRIAWLIGKWVSEECCLPNHPRIWEILVHLISPEIETVVRLTAAAALKDCVDVGFFTYVCQLCHDHPLPDYRIRGSFVCTFFDFRRSATYSTYGRR